MSDRGTPYDRIAGSSDWPAEPPSRTSEHVHQTSQSCGCNVDYCGSRCAFHASDQRKHTHALSLGCWPTCPAWPATLGPGIATNAHQTASSSRGTGVLRPGGDGRNAPTVRPPLDATSAAEHEWIARDGIRRICPRHPCPEHAASAQSSPGDPR